MDYLVVCTISFFVAGLTLFSGFGLATVLMPAFAFFFPLPVAVAATAIVHLMNNLFKLALVGRHAKADVVIRFALPAAVAAILGAALLQYFSAFPSIFHYRLGGNLHQITVIKLIIALLIILFALFDLVPVLKKLAFPPKYLTVGGALSGFFGGLSGHQGALRSAFLIKAGLAKESFIGTGVVAAVVVDISRLMVYGVSFYSQRFEIIEGHMVSLVLSACIAAFLGSYGGKQLLKKMTIDIIQTIVGVLLILIGIGLATGLL